MSRRAQDERSLSTDELAVKRPLPIPLLLLVLLAATGDVAAQWPEFRGPTGQGHSTDTGCRSSGARRGTCAGRRRSRDAAGRRPSIAGGRVWLTTAVDADGRVAARARVRRRDRPRGRRTSKSSRSKRPIAVNPKNSHASPTPIVDGDRVYVHFGADGTAALTTDRRGRLEDAAARTSRSTATAARRSSTAIC